MIERVDRRFGTLFVDQHAASMKLCDPLDLAGGTESLETIDQNELIVLDTNNHGRELPVTLQGTRHGTFRIRVVKTISLQSFIDLFEVQQPRFIGLPIELGHDCLHAVELPTTERKSLFPCSIPLEPVTLGPFTSANIDLAGTWLDIAHSARTAITRIRRCIDGDPANGGSNAVLARGLVATRYGRNSYRTFSGESEREDETARNNQVDGTEVFWARSPLYSPRHSHRGAIRPALYAGGIAGDIEPTVFAGILFQRRWRDSDDWLSVAPICARQQNIRGCSTDRRDEADRIDAHNPLANKDDSGRGNQLDSIDRLRNAERGPREPLIPKRSSLVAKLLTSQQGVFRDHTSR
jgi:hypothetical protein